LEKREGVESEAAQIERWEDEKSGSKRQSVPVVLGVKGGVEGDAPGSCSLFGKKTMKQGEHSKSTPFFLDASKAPQTARTVNEH
jgi:hypothetical protein